jgi:hypothetical protein
MEWCPTVGTVGDVYYQLWFALTAEELAARKALPTVHPIHIGVICIVHADGALVLYLCCF